MGNCITPAFRHCVISILPASPIQMPPHLIQLLRMRYSRMETAEDSTCNQESEPHDLRESIVAIDVREKRTIGCSIFSTADGVLKIANDIPMANENVAEQFLNYAQPTTILMSRRVPETILTFVEKHVERNAKGEHFPMYPASYRANHHHSSLCGHQNLLCA